MDNQSLSELIKEYVYNKSYLEQDPSNASLRLKLAKLSMAAGLYRTALELTKLPLAEDPGQIEAVEIASNARDIVSRAAGLECVICADRSGAIIVVDRILNRVVKLSSIGQQIWCIDREGFEDDSMYHPDLLTIDTDNSIYVGSSVLSRIQVFDEDGVFLRAFPVPKKYGSRIRMASITCDDSGNLWVMDELSRTLKMLDSEGNEASSITIKYNDER